MYQLCDLGQDESLFLSFSIYKMGTVPILKGHSEDKMS